jgi:hypothetical protein
MFSANSDLHTSALDLKELCVGSQQRTNSGPHWNGYVGRQT